MERSVREVVDSDSLQDHNCSCLLTAFGIANARLAASDVALGRREEKELLAPLLVAQSASLPLVSHYLLAASCPQTRMLDEEFHDAIWVRLGLTAPRGHDQCEP